MKKKIIVIYVILLLVHIAHVIEEVLTDFQAGQKLGTGLFIIINFILFCIPVLFFILHLKGNKYGYYGSVLYALIMVLNGLYHNVMVLITGQYYGGFSGAVSGIFLIIFGIYLLLMLKKYKREIKFI